jgi:hypothetical protein
MGPLFVSIRQFADDHSAGHTLCHWIALPRFVFRNKPFSQDALMRCGFTAQPPVPVLDLLHMSPSADNACVILGRFQDSRMTTITLQGFMDP